MLVLGLDISTSCIGVCALNGDESSNKSSVLLVDAIQLHKFKSMWQKVDAVESYFNDLTHKPDVLSIEEPLLGFRQGMSSAQTIAQLLKFNGIVSYVSKKRFGLEPTYLSAPTARKTCGIKVQKTSVAGPQKEQVFEHMCRHDLSMITWPLKKNGMIVDWSRDACDAYVIARAAFLTSPRAT